MIRIGIDVGGTNTDAVVMDGARVLAGVKAATTGDVMTGVVNALADVLKASGKAASDIDVVMIGTTHFTNAVVQRREDRGWVLPKGKLKPDETPIAAALREAHEEIYLAPEHAHVLGTLLPYETGTGYRVTPVVAWLHPAARLAPNPLEVAEVFRVPLDFLMNPANHRKHVWQPTLDQRREWFSMPYTDTSNGQ